MIQVLSFLAILPLPTCHVFCQFFQIQVAFVHPNARKGHKTATDNPLTVHFITYILRTSSI